MRIELRLIAAFVAGCLTAVAIALAITGIARIIWPAYAAAEPRKTYSFAMLVSRLLVGAICTAVAACVASIIVRDNGKVACWLGMLFLIVSLPDHLYRVWPEYPVWYHVLYLSYLVPIAAITGRVFSNCVDHNVYYRDLRAKS
jgi:hypothetical protein